MKIAVIGATGTLGRNVVPRLLAHGHDVRAIVRRAEAVPRFAAIGAETAVANIFDTDALAAALAGCDAPPIWRRPCRGLARRRNGMKIPRCAPMAHGRSWPPRQRRAWLGRCTKASP
jgi:NAD(P)-dependent dehydrogenase (short-subunit alcohol dehydrogenase family)